MAVSDATHVESRQRGRYPTGFPVRCTEAEKREIFARAEQANRSASRFLVESVIAADGNGLRSRPSREEVDVIEGLMVQLRRLASNLHELASREHAASGDDSDAPAAVEIDEAVLEVRGMLDQLRSRLV
jgi:hypothetical protein